MSDEEQRVHARIHVSTSVELATVARPDERRSAVLKDISKGGARLLVPEPVGRPGTTVTLFLPSLMGPDIVVSAEVVRVEERKDGYMVGTRFDEVAEEMRQPLLDFIEVLLSTAGGQARAQARVARRMEIRFADLDELRATIEDIVAGELSMTVGAPLVLYEEIDVLLPDTTGEPLLVLRARVVRQRAVEDGGEAVYRVALEMLPLREEASACLGAVSSAVERALQASVTAAAE